MQLVGSSIKRQRLLGEPRLSAREHYWIIECSIGVRLERAARGLIEQGKRHHHLKRQEGAFDNRPSIVGHQVDQEAVLRAEDQGMRLMQIMNVNDPALSKTLESCVQYGQPLLLENFQSYLDPVLIPILSR